MICDFGTVANGDTETQTFIVDTDSAAAPSVDNTATVGSDTPDPNNANDSDTETTTVSSADLSIDKQDSPDPVNAGDEITYTLEVTNAGPSDAANVTSTDTLPAGLTFDSSLDNCFLSGGDVICDFGTVAANDTETQTFIVDTDSAAAPSVDNTAEVGSDTPDPDTSNNADTETTTVNAADLSIDKTDTPDPIDVGEQIIYTLEVSNGGPSDADNVHAEDTLPNGLTFVSGDVGCSAAGQDVDCDFGTVAATDTESLSFTVGTGAAAAPSVDNTATVTSDTTDTDPGDDSDTVTTTVNAVADLSIDKSDVGSDPVHVGDPITYELAVTNNGPNDATDVVVTDALPAGTSFNAGASDADCDVLAGVVTCTYGTVADGASVSKDLVLDTDAAAAPLVSNTAEVSAPVTDSNTANNSDTETTTVDPSADLAIDKTDAGDVTVGGQITYTLAVTNNGPSNATGIEVTDDLPTGTTFDGGSSDADCGDVAGTVTCFFNPIASGFSDSKIIVLDTAAAAAPTVSNTAVVDGDQDDPDTANNSDTETTDVGPLSDLSITKSDNPDPVLAGEDITYTLSVANAGPNDATGVEATDDLPPGLTFKAAGTSAACTEAGGTVTCDYGNVASGASEDLTIVVTTGVAAIPSVDNTASVEGDQGDPDPTDDSDTETTTVLASSDLSIALADNPDPFSAGNKVSYAISVTNAGPNDATDVVAAGAVPAGATFDPIGSDSQCSETAGLVSCDFGNVADGATEALVAVFDTAGASPPGITFTLAVAANELDANPADNTASESTTLAGSSVPPPVIVPAPPASTPAPPTTTTKKKKSCKKKKGKARKKCKRRRSKGL